MQSKQLRRRQKLNNQLSKSKKMATKTTAEVVWRPSAEDGNAAMVAVAAKATAEGGGGVAGRRGGGGDCSDSCRGVQRSSSDIIDDHCSTGESWSITRPNHDGGGGGGGEKNRHTPSSYRRQTAILPDCTNSRGGVLNVVHCRCVSVGGGGVHPSNDQKDNDESGRCGGTVSIW